MAKIRVYELARDLKMESKVLLIKMKALGITVPSHQSTLTAAQIEKIRANEAHDQPKVVVRRRRKSESSSGDEVLEAGDATGEEGASLGEGEVGSSAAFEQEVEPDEGTVSRRFSHERGEEVASARETEAAELSYAADAVGHRNDEVVEKTTAEDRKALYDVNVEAGDIDKKKLDVIEALARQAEEREKTKGRRPRDFGAEVDDTRDSAAGLAQGGHTGASNYMMHEHVDLEGRDRSSKKFSQVEGSTGTLRRPPGEGREREPRRSHAPAPVANPGAAGTAIRKKAGFTGATIVRKATPEETKALRAKTEEVRQRTSRREDSRGMRVTGIGINTRMSDAPKSEGHVGHGGHGRGEIRPAFADPAAAVPGMEETGKWSRDRVGRQGDLTKKRIEEEEQRAIKNVPHMPKRRLSTRDLLVEADAPEVEEEGSAAEAAGRKRRVVYTPNAPQRRRDLKRRKDLKATPLTTPRAAYRVVKMEAATISVGELAKQLSVKASELIKKFMDQGVMATLNQSLDFDTAAIVASEYGFECKNLAKSAEDVLKIASEERFNLQNRPPIITVMGHVDHGKTSILDAIRQSEVAAGESGGITQHIGAYTVDKGGFRFTFLDTPGHEAFSAMRSRGANLTDIVVLVVAADDGVMPQTKEAISHAQKAEVPIIVAVNKVDKPNINLDRIYTELSEFGVQAEEWGGETQFVKVSALKKIGLDQLLEAIQIQAEVLELQSRFDGPAEGVVVEGHLDKGRGPVATVMVMKGTLKVGDYLVAGQVTGRVRAMTDHKGQKLTEATPATPVEVIGLTAVPMSGDPVNVVEDDKIAKEAADIRRQQQDELQNTTSAAASLEELLGRVQAAEVPDVPLIIKADTQGSVEAIAASLEKLNTKKVRNTVIHRGVGGINESDVHLAQTSGAVIIGFNVRAAGTLFDQADKRGVVIKYFSIIYELMDTVKNLMAGKLPPICTEVVQGHAEVRNPISVPKIGVIAGSAVTDGKITRASLLRLIRDKVVIYSGKIGSLRRFKDDVREVQHGYECGIGIDGYNDIRVGDVIEAYMIEESAATLDSEA